MARLFFSLYIVITFALVSLSAALESIFLPVAQESNNSHVATLLAAAKQQDVDIIQLIEASNLPLRRFSITDLSWSKAQLAQLQAGASISLYDEANREQIYLLSDDGVVLEVTVTEPGLSFSSTLWYRSIFFILLAAVIALWLWPLWRDLNLLKKAVTTTMPDGNIAENAIGANSLVAPIAKALNSMRGQISQLLRNQRELSGAVAHEFRTPLARLKFALGMQEQSEMSQWQDMQQDVVELERLVQEMLDFSASEAHLPTLHFAEIPLLSLCEALLQKLKSSHLHALDAKLVGPATLLLGDDLYVERALENLLVNASRYAKSKLRISIVPTDEYVEVSVEDDGPGIEENLRAKVFEPFFRPDEGRGRKQGGAGLGLAIVSRIMQWHQGECSISDSEFGGAKFILRFPNETQV
ncbi:MAG: two-component sensor histidine kinase [Paraglaciecola sp.]|nr:two-component sensor histidine kinase [Paraglaciecola sp.]NCT47987.1 two-component sensor histidine kinase [Paraglaciecola sp.]